MSVEILVDGIQSFILKSPDDLMDALCRQLDVTADWEQAGTKIVPMLPSAELRGLLGTIFAAAKQRGYRPEHLSFAFRAGASVESYHRNYQQLELVWTGPSVVSSTLRRTDEALLQLISTAQDRLTLVSFAVYRIERLSQALEDALDRGVTTRLFFEMNHTALIAGLIRHVDPSKIQVYTWSDKYRPRSMHNKLAVLHAKTAIADGKQLFISSANLTENAMSLNIELGIIVTNGGLPEKVERVFTDLIERGIFIPTFPTW